MVESPPGDDFAKKTVHGLCNAWALVVFGTSEYGAKTGAGYETYWELKYAHDHDLYLVPIQLCKDEDWPPAPADFDGGSEGAELNHFVLSKTIVRAVDMQMKQPERVAKEIAPALLEQATVRAVDMQMEEPDRVAEEIAAALREQEARVGDRGYVRDRELPLEMRLQMPPTEADMYKMTVIGLKNQKHGEFLYANNVIYNSERRHVLTWGGGPETPLEPVQKNAMRFNMVDFGDYVGFQSELHKEWMYVGEPNWNRDRRYVLTWKGSGSPKTNEMMRFKIFDFKSYVGIKNVRLDQWVYANDPHWGRHRRYVLSWKPEGHPTTNPGFRWELKELGPASLVKIL